MVKCADCGFIALRQQASRELRDAEMGYRESLENPYVPTGATEDPFMDGHIRPALAQAYEPLPICFVGAINFRDKLSERNPDQPLTFNGLRNPPDDWLRSLLYEERECDGFTEWKQGSTPKEHQEMLDRQWMLDREDKRDADLGDWQERQSEL